MTTDKKSVYYLLMSKNTSQTKKGSELKKKKEPSISKKGAAKKAPAKAVATKPRAIARAKPRAAAPRGEAKKTTEKQKGKVSFKKEVIQKLLEAKNRILQEVSHKVKSESDSHKFEIGDIYDIASTERERELTLMLGDRDRGKLAEIEDALDRLNNSSYGECEECGEPIAEDRLRALPFTRVCIECQSRSEKEQKIRGRFEEESGLGIMEKGEMEEEEF